MEYLLRTPLGRRLAERVEAADVVAPELLDVEVLAVLRRAVLGRRLGTERAETAIGDLVDWNIRRLRHGPLLAEAWSFRANVSAYDALYLAAGRLCDAPVLTTDGPLARAPGMGVVVENLRA